MGEPSTLAERIEDERQRRRRNGLASIGDLDDDIGLPAVDPQLDRRSRLAVLDRVADEIGEQLVQPIAVPHAGQVAPHIHAQRPVRMRQLRLADHLPADIVHVEALGIDRNAAAQPAPRQVEQLIDQAAPPAKRCA